MIINKSDLKNYKFKNFNYLDKDKISLREYKFYAYFSSLFNNIIIYDVGTYRGNSAVALADNPTNFVYSFDIKNYITCKELDNIRFIHIDFRYYIDVYNKNLHPELWLIDVGNHDGIIEDNMYQFIQKYFERYIIIFDDIRLNNGMKIFWNSISDNKLDITDIGHWSGTGIVWKGYDVEVKE